MAENNNCDGSGPHAAGEVRVLSHGKDAGNSILCRWCWGREMSFRIERNRKLAKDVQYDILSFEQGQVYGGAPCMTPRRALEILLHVWGNANNLTAELAREIDLEGLNGETALQTVCRVAGVPFEQTRPFEHSWVRALVAQRERELAQEVKW